MKKMKTCFEIVINHNVRKSVRVNQEQHSRLAISSRHQHITTGRRSDDLLES